MNDLKKLKLRN